MNADPPPAHIESADARQVERLRFNIRLLLKAVGGDPTNCRACGCQIWFVRTKAGRNAPFTEDGLNHFADCPAAESFRNGVRS